MNKSEWKEDGFEVKEQYKDFLTPIEKGFSVGLISEAGCPAVADPGSVVVEIAHIKNIKVCPLVGPSSVLLSFMASGFAGHNFAFNGYLPIDKKLRINALKKLEKKAIQENQSQIFIETPYRNEKLFSDMLQCLMPKTKICVATDITLQTEQIKTLSVENWKKEKLNINKRPTIFIIGK